MRYAGAGAYTLLFANAAKLWTKLVIRKPAALIVAWTNAILGMLAFIFFSLPDVGSKELYQVWSPWCSTISSSLYACSTWEADNVSTSEDGSWFCANATSLVFDEGELVPIQFEWGFAGLVGLLLIVSAYKHIRFWANRERGIAYGQTLADKLYHQSLGRSSSDVCYDRLYRILPHPCCRWLLGLDLLRIISSFEARFYYRGCYGVPWNME